MALCERALRRFFYWGDVSDMGWQLSRGENPPNNYRFAKPMQPEMEN
jgi:hypothetical protein